MAELKRRAVTDAQKQFRRQEILDGARAYFEASSYEGFTMTQLAGRLGIVKGTSLSNLLREYCRQNTKRPWPGTGTSP